MSTNRDDEGVGMFNLSSKFMKVFLVIIAAFLVFVGPTYVPYVLVNVLDLNHVASIILGFVLLLVGLALMWYLIRKKIIE